MPLQGEYAPSPAKWVRDQVATYESSGGTAGTTLRGMPVVVMTMRGVSSGNLLKVPVMRVEHDGVYAVVASKGGSPDNPQWVRSLTANPEIELQDGPETRNVTARQVFGDEKASWWERAVAAYPDYAAYQKKTTRQIPVFVLE
jgi:deazaflavin-dependent oxidoreductase (nitroreductase family)